MKSDNETNVPEAADSDISMGGGGKRVTTKNSKDVYGAVGRTNLLMFDPDHLVIVEDQNAPLFDRRALEPADEKLVRNIMHHGVIQPVAIRKNPETGVVEVVAGRRRVRAAREANLRLLEQGLEPLHVPATVTRGDDGYLTSVMVSENEIRKEDSPMNRAEKMQRLVNLGKSEREIGLLFGVGIQTVKNTLSLLECCAAVRTAVNNGSIGVAMATDLSKMKPEEQRETLEKMLSAASTEVRPHKRARKMHEAAGKKQRPTPKMLQAYRQEIKEKSCDAEFTSIAVAILDFVLGGAKPRIPKSLKDSKVA